ncbi:hypothetical protein BGZ46_003553 [Entomortierella lignicola]|nr:hypothetical protein BGZ46_003553 [Entomortierella lignicola]
MSVMSHGESVISAYGLNPFSKNAARSVMGGSQYRAGSVVEGPYVIGYCAHGRSGSTTSARSSQIAMGGASVFSSDQPTNEQLANETQNVLAIADLMSITEKQVRTIYTSSESP